ncbi:DUF302 domain-containing protein [Grimontia kaedaensis]|uniref:DUF302 domain-containing protein n=1 Tax=Grimontia kaedaensis TaxID=2872157 RepID=A0ABY4X0G2_9GAMM|nr:DUF302 domain-containing protein [Grimontia kaedaensis]USH04717.1 DUF302 domain-containing protein [Grimontia kaedaensis]
MRLNIQLFAFIAAFFSLPSTALEGMVQVQSQYDVRTTTDRLIAAVRARGLNVISRIDHEDGARETGKDLRPSELVTFGNPNMGTPLMECSQTAGIDQPQKALIWEDDNGKVWLGYNNPNYVVKRHRLDKCDLALKKVEKALVTLAKLATQPTPQQ